MSKPKTLAEGLLAFFTAIEGSGGVFQYPDGTYGCVGDPDWLDLADAYLILCAASARKPKIEKRPAEYAHQYDSTMCHVCQNDLTQTGEVIVVCIADEGSPPYELRSQLDLDGYLEDPDGDIAKGRHSDTLCGSCRASISDYEEHVPHAESEDGQVHDAGRDVDQDPEQAQE